MCVARDIYVRTAAWIAVTCRFSCSEGMKGVPIDGFVYVESGDDLKKECWLRCCVRRIFSLLVGVYLRSGIERARNKKANDN